MISNRKNRHLSIFVTLFVAGLLLSNSAWINLKAVIAQVLIERAWSISIETGERVTPWSWADFWPVARMRVVSNGDVLYVLSSASGESLAFGPGHVNGSVLPGASGSSILAGHRDTHFEFLKQVKRGDKIEIQRADNRLRRYRVTDLEVVNIKNTELMIEQEDSDLRLVTCYPFDAVMPGGTKRLVVKLQLDV